MPQDVSRLKFCADPTRVLQMKKTQAKRKEWYMLEKEETWQKYVNNWFLMPSHLCTQLIQGQGAEQGDGINRNCLSTEEFLAY